MPTTPVDDMGTPKNGDLVIIDGKLAVADRGGSGSSAFAAKLSIIRSRGA